ncbi:IS110 family transposase [Mesorhizobium captivum]|uniref:IS110 family transposase n=1 Tax=Mesorhizobium captivum TaxID=3072319 RepID=UPI002A242C05|nr:transposase [Mesorhizobium sp. VK3C]MDX8450813.1 transposase [Mesorhizobium sp. VK3C]
MERGFKVHAINPKEMDRFRDRFTLAGAKDDSRDAEVMASALRTDPRCCSRSPTPSSSNCASGAHRRRPQRRAHPRADDRQASQAPIASAASMPPRAGCIAPAAAQG